MFSELKQENQANYWVFCEQEENWATESIIKWFEINQVGHILSILTQSEKRWFDMIIYVLVLLI